MGTRTPWFWASTGLEPGASGVRRPCANPLGNLTTVGHLAKASPDLSPHFPDLNPHFKTQSHIFSRHFNNGKSSFLTHDGALGVIMGGNESYGRPASF